MKVEHRKSGGDERRVLIGMITDPVVLGRLETRWSGKDFGSKWSDLIGGWCVEHYRRHREAPGKSIESRFERWQEKQRDEATVKLVDRFLSGLSGEYEQGPKEHNSDFVVDLAGRHWNRIRITRLKEQLEADLESGDCERSLERIGAFSSVDLGNGSSIDVLEDMAAIEAAFSEGQDDLVEYPGALGQFYSGIFCREAFVTFMGPEKRGKCISEDMEVLLADGRVCSIGMIVDNEDRTPIVSLNERTQRFVAVSPTQFWKNGRKECWELRTRTGRHVITTANHFYLTPDGWKHLDDIKVGDFVAVPKRLNFFGSRRMHDNDVKFLAYMLAEGGCTTGRLTFTNADPIMVEDFHQTCRALSVRFLRKGITSGLSGPGSHRLKRDYRCALWEVSSKTKRIPNSLFMCPKDQIAEFLRIFFSCDGNISKDGDRIELTLANKRLTEQIGHLLTRFGIVHHLSKKRISKKTGVTGKHFKSWRISIRCQEHVNLFLREINFLSYKRTDPKPEDENGRSFLDKFPSPVAERFLGEMREEHPDPITPGFLPMACKSLTSHRGAGKGKYVRPGHAFRKAVPQAPLIREQIAKGKPIMRRSFDGCSGRAYEKYMESDILWDEVDSVRSVGKKQTYDLGVPDYHNFVANDCIVHNSFELMDFVYRATCQRRRVAYFEVGDMGQRLTLRRLAGRISKQPIRPRDETVDWPTKMRREDGLVKVTREPRGFEILTWRNAIKAIERLKRMRTKTDEPLLKLSSHPNSSISVGGIEAQLEAWERDGWVADCVAIDYADILAPPAGKEKLDERAQINATWQHLRALAQRRHACLVTATQADAESYDKDLIRMKNFSGDKRKLSHVTAMIGLNQTEQEKKEGVMRRNFVVLREGDFSVSRCVHSAQCLPLGNPSVKSMF